MSDESLQVMMATMISLRQQFKVNKVQNVLHDQKPVDE